MSNSLGRETNNDIANKLGHQPEQSESYRVALSKPHEPNKADLRISQLRQGAVIPEEREPLSTQLATLTGNQMASEEPDEPMIYVLYPIRWYVMTCVALLNFSNTALWICLASVSNHADRYFEWQGVSTWLSLSYIVTTIPLSLPAMYFSRRFGLRCTIHTAAVFNGVGAVIRIVALYVPVSYSGIMSLAGAGVAGCAYPFIMFLPAKVGATWFGDKERMISTTVISLANPLGVLMPMLISPQLVRRSSSVPYAVLWPGIICIVSALMSLIGIKMSNPPQAPSASALSQQLSFCQGIKRCLKSRSYLILFVSIGAGIAMFNTLYTVLQELLCSRGYSNSFTGLCPVIMIVCGLIGGTISGILANKYKIFVEILKVEFCLAVISGLTMIQFARHPDMVPAIIIFCIFFGMFGIGVYPIGMELAAEVAFPASETTSTGLMVFCGQIQSAIYIQMIAALREDLEPKYKMVQQCKDISDPNDLAVMADHTLPMLIFSGIASFIAIFMVIFLHPTYNRINYEAQQGRKLEVIKNKNQEVAQKEEIIHLNKREIKSNVEENEAAIDTERERLT